MSETFDLEPEFLRFYDLCRDQTMTSIERMYALYKATCHVVERNIPGHFVECGVWRGGSIMLIAMTLLARRHDDREIWLYDTFRGMTPPSPDDVQDLSGRSASEILAENRATPENPFWGIAAKEVVEENLRRTRYPADRFHFVEGDVLKTIPAHAPQCIALLRLDTDWYASTKHELEQLYPRIPSQGVLLIDDYGYWRGARKATDEYFGAEGPLLHRIDFTGRIAVKP